MKVIDLIKGITDSETLSSMMIDLVNEAPTIDKLTPILERELTEEQLQTIKSIADSGNYPLSLIKGEIAKDNRQVV
ncbi:hypothetical protein DWW50_09745 [Eubacterium sp. AF15-50]|uniref:hypothetical protein n=1 Tax=unclassified Eubacterium (in: firmicutes) TaxID=2624479 RepID=UPI000E51616D|nr:MULTISPECIES: hypothetical protein [unclassified Eubacterium (in: firmicutes)]RHR72599.1 hypothetical protein DWW68_06330 [Eubacterium sp. AF16-48]RHR77843.1 hypothetical protein DWW50_09745 [Eubacterium sp. AF15-50]